MKNKYLLVCLVVANSICANIDPGSLDDSFGKQGLVTTDFTDIIGIGFNSETYALILQADSKIVAGGSFDNGSDVVFALARYNTDGSLDTGFGMNGLVTTDFANIIGMGSGSSSTNALVLQTDGNILAAGQFFNGSNSVFALARYNTDGSLDKSFGVDGTGLVTTDFANIIGMGTFNSVSALALQTDGKIVAAGQFFNGSNSVFALARYNTDGSLDKSFGSTGNGLVTTDFANIIGMGSGSRTNALVLQADGKIVAAGRFDDGSDTVFALARYNIDGSLDTEFGVDGTGLVTTDFGGASEVNAFALQADGKLLAAGRFDDGSDTVFALARYNIDGSLDTEFGVDGTGLVTTDFADILDMGSNSSAFALTLQTDGKIVAAGRFNGGSNNVFALARYNIDGSLDTEFGSTGTGLVITDFANILGIGGLSEATAAMLQADGKIVAAGYFENGPNLVFALARYNTGVETSKIPQSIFGKYAKNTDKNKQLNW